jgi:hypothetical protein
MIHSPENFKADPPAGFDGQFDWDVFKENGCWGNGKINLMDFDGVVERNNHFIVFETKDEGKGVSEGQRMTLDSLRRARSFTVAYLWPKSPPFKRMDMQFQNGMTKTIEGHEAIIETVKRWYGFANDGMSEPKIPMKTLLAPSDADAQLDAIWAGVKPR